MCVHRIKDNAEWKDDTYFGNCIIVDVSTRSFWEVAKSVNPRSTNVMRQQAQWKST